MTGNSFVVLGIDPGSRITGWGCVALNGSLQHIAHGTIRLDKSMGLSERLGFLYKEVLDIVDKFDVHVASVESVFMGKNTQSALKLGEARGAILAALATKGVEVFEYTPNQVKATITRYGHASKEQIREMVKVLLGFNGRLALDASDAIALAMTHLLLRGGGA